MRLARGGTLEDSTLIQPIIRYGELPQQETDDLVAQAKALRDFIPAQKRIQFSQDSALCESKDCDDLIRVIRQGLEDGRTLRKIRYCEIDHDTGSGGVWQYVCLWDDEPDIGNWHGRERNPYMEEAIESSPWRTVT